MSQEFTITLNRDEAFALQLMAIREYRTAEQQAAYLIKASIETYRRDELKLPPSTAQQENATPDAASPRPVSE